MPIPFDDWPARLDAAAEATRGHITRIHVVREVGSTQDEARRRGVRPGEAVVAGRQTAGRGRLGRTWADTGEDGVALTVALPSGESPRLALLGAVATATAIESVLADWSIRLNDRAHAPAGGAPRVGIKWPNDIVVDGRKLAGVLVEQADGVVLMGIGVNVSQRRWPVELATTATSLLDVADPLRPGDDHSAAPASCIDRIDVACALLRAIATTADATDDSLIAAFRARDSLTGSIRSLRCGDEQTVGTIVEIDPLRWLRVRRSDGSTASLPAALTRVEK